MNEVITLADPAVSCDMAKNIADRIDALALVLSVALESPRRTEAERAAPAVLAVIRIEAGRVRQRAEDAADAIVRAAT
ncbi:hypothetical protein C8D93_109189 [Sinimarinibacterium flocculans]|uniref:Uncharacterized protein n=3 Tax=Sinimarinibacterium flocculans TaxID=985250 RepID=A0A318E9X3_9GAMM|nr:hypothetical protein C8D93_109189 [Sinimarinibacterium flocculans]